MEAGSLPRLERFLAPGGPFQPPERRAAVADLHREESFTREDVDQAVDVVGVTSGNAPTGDEMLLDDEDLRHQRLRQGRHPFRELRTHGGKAGRCHASPPSAR